MAPISYLHSWFYSDAQYLGQQLKITLRIGVATYQANIIFIVLELLLLPYTSALLPIIQGKSPKITPKYHYYAQE